MEIFLKMTPLPWRHVHSQSVSLVFFHHQDSRTTCWRVTLQHLQNFVVFNLLSAKGIQQKLLSVAFWTILSALSMMDILSRWWVDISAAFDAVPHDALVHRLDEEFGISGTCSQWITSYLADRSYSVRVGIHLRRYSCQCRPESHRALF